MTSLGIQSSILEQVVKLNGDNWHTWLLSRWRNKGWEGLSLVWHHKRPPLPPLWSYRSQCHSQHSWHASWSQGTDSQQWLHNAYFPAYIIQSITHAHICGLPLLSVPTSFHSLQKPTTRIPIMELGGMIGLFSRNAFNSGNILITFRL